MQNINLSVFLILINCDYGLHNLSIKDNKHIFSENLIIYYTLYLPFDKFKKILI